MVLASVAEAIRGPSWHSHGVTHCTIGCPTAMASALTEAYFAFLNVCHGLLRGSAGGLSEEELVLIFGVMTSCSRLPSDESELSRSAHYSILLRMLFPPPYVVSHFSFSPYSLPRGLEMPERASEALVSALALDLAALCEAQVDGLVTLQRAQLQVHVVDVLCSHLGKSTALLLSAISSGPDFDSSSTLSRVGADLEDFLRASRTVERALRLLGLMLAAPFTKTLTRHLAAGSLLEDLLPLLRLPMPDIQLAALRGAFSSLKGASSHLLAVINRLFSIATFSRHSKEVLSWLFHHLGTDWLPKSPFTSVHGEDLPQLVAGSLTPELLRFVSQLASHAQWQHALAQELQQTIERPLEFVAGAGVPPRLVGALLVLAQCGDCVPLFAGTRVHVWVAAEGRAHEATLTSLTRSQLVVTLHTAPSRSLTLPPTALLLSRPSPLLLHRALFGACQILPALEHLLVSLDAHKAPPPVLRYLLCAAVAQLFASPGAPPPSPPLLSSLRSLVKSAVSSSPTVVAAELALSLLAARERAERALALPLELGLPSPAALPPSALSLAPSFAPSLAPSIAPSTRRVATVRGGSSSSAREVRAGDTVELLEPPLLRGRRGIVRALSRDRNRLCVRLSSLLLWLPRSSLHYLRATPPPLSPTHAPPALFEELATWEAMFALVHISPPSLLHADELLTVLFHLSPLSPFPSLVAWSALHPPSALHPLLTRTLAALELLLCDAASSLPLFQRLLLLPWTASLVPALAWLLPFLTPAHASLRLPLLGLAFEHLRSAPSTALSWRSDLLHLLVLIATGLPSTGEGEEGEDTVWLAEELQSTSAMCSSARQALPHQRRYMRALVEAYLLLAPPSLPVNRLAEGKRMQWALLDDLPPLVPFTRVTACVAQGRLLLAHGGATDLLLNEAYLLLLCEGQRKEPLSLVQKEALLSQHKWPLHESKAALYTFLADESCSLLRLLTALVPWTRTPLDLSSPLKHTRAFPLVHALKHQPHSLCALVRALARVWAQWAEATLPFVPLAEHLPLPRLGALLPALRDTLSPAVVVPYLRRLWARLPLPPSPPSVHVHRLRSPLLRAKITEDSPLPPAESVFEQLHRQLLLLPGEALRGGWQVSFEGEEAVDGGGLFRDALALTCDELQSDLLTPSPLLRAPHASPSVWLLHPHADPSAAYFLGQLIGVALCTSTSLALSLPSLLWKALTGQAVGREDLRQIDPFCAQSLDALGTEEPSMLLSLERDWDGLIFETWTTTSSAGTPLHLRPGQADVTVTFSQREEFVHRVEEERLAESRSQLSALEAGLHSVLPLAPLQLLSWRDLERLVCGEVALDLTLLRLHTEYRGYTEADAPVRAFWGALGLLQAHEHSAFLRFVGGHSRLPSAEHWPETDRLVLCAVPSTPAALPTAATCFWQLNWPPYENAEEAKRALLTAITYSSGFT